MNWTTVALATGPAAITGALGYFGARLQSRASLRQAEIALESQTTQFREDHRRHRQSTYHDLLDATRALDNILVGLTPRDRDLGSKFVTWWNNWKHHINGTYLYGTDDVRLAARQLNDVIASVASVADAGSVKLQEGWEQARPEFIAAYEGLVDAMRADVAPEAERTSE